MLRILVVDDDALMVRALAALLDQDGHSVAAFTDGGDAVKALHAETFDVVVTDLDMPSVDGLEVMRQAEGRNHRACLVVMSGKSPDHEKLAGCGACLIVDKPIDYEQMTREVLACRARGGPAVPRACHCVHVAAARG
jgi:CheY-like chemotaxis protein